MGASCSTGANVSDETSCKDTQKKFTPPEAITCISGVDVDRTSPLYQYALFCVTRLMDKYKDFMFPHVTMNLGSFREDLQNYLDVIEEIYNNLCFEERLLTNGKVNFEADSYAKDATSQLAFLLWKMAVADPKKSTAGQVSLSGDHNNKQNITGHGVENTVDDSHESINDSDVHSRRGSTIALSKIQLLYANEKDALQDSESYKYCYEDTLKLLITDLERKEIWQMSTLHSNQLFQEFLKEKEPDTYNELNDESVTIEVPKPLQRKVNQQISSDDEG